LPTPLPTLSVSIEDTLAELTTAYRVAGRSPHTTALFATYVGNLVRYLASDDDGTTAIDEITTGHLTRFLDSEQRRANLKPASLSVILRTLRRFFAYAVEQGHITSSPAKAVMAPRIVVEPVQFLSDDQLALLLATIARDKTVEGVRDTAMVRVLMDTGLRRGELMALRVTEDIDLDTCLITVRAITSKTRRGRTVPVGDETVAALKRYLKVRRAYLAAKGRTDDGLLWISAKGSLSANGALQALRRRLRAAGLPQVTMHSLRHGWAAGVIEDGLPMPYVVKLGGWSNATMPTNRYGQFGIGERAIDAMRALQNR